MRDPQTLELDGCSVSSAPLPYERAEDLLPEMAQLIAGVVHHGAAALSTIQGDIKTLDVAVLASVLGPVLSVVAEKLGAGTLKRLAPLLLATTQVIMPDASGQKARYELSKASDRASVFDEHPEHYFAILFFAGKVTFARFFPVKGLLASSGLKMANA